MTFEELCEKLSSTDPHNRRLAVHGAEASLDLRAVSLLVRTAKTDSDSGVRSLALHGLRGIRLRLQEADRMISDLPEFRRTTAPPSTPTSLPTIEDADAAVRHKAVGRLAQARDKAAVPSLLAALAQESEGWVRAEIAFALGQLGGGDGAMEALTKLLSDPVTRARANAIEALWKIGAKGYDEAALPLLEDPDRRVRSNTALALSIGHWSRAEQVLMKLARSSDKLDREAALFCTAKLPAHRRGGLIAILRFDSVKEIQLRAEKLAE